MGNFKVVVREISLSTRRKLELIDITAQVERVAAESGIRNGVCLVFAPHATAAIIANEHEEGLLKDIEGKISELFPVDQPYLHNRIDDNAHAHIASSFIGASLVLPVVNGRLLRGTWQNIFLVELDGPRSSRKVVVEVMGESSD
ncbi:secondary thiamine-phosphate synthase enzyme YjbQ [Thermofilum pendens]|uniref:YjbQ family protein n=1 Tax=Thermofilum pendens (strain DSM 2475 / Hrk 5) TaxID=368408 RepID=A1RXS8_THEPD|nr:secondary thiamine-phosphate synthase enzyme YjbQ [Thermofilum pendens]ABL78008.1 protein of unknown function UPF0047 [Thermofilum pendens Hrk 5]